MEQEKNCSFQFAYTKYRIFGDTVIVHDQSGITLSEAQNLFNKYKEQIIGILKNKDDYQSMEAVIWINMPDEFTYGLVYVTLDFDTDGKDIWEIKKEYVKI